MNQIKQVMLAHDEAGPYAIFWPSKGQHEYRNLSASSIRRLGRIVDKMVLNRDFEMFPVGTGEVGWFARRPIKWLKLFASDNDMAAWLYGDEAPPPHCKGDSRHVPCNCGSPNCKLWHWENVCQCELCRDARRKEYYEDEYRKLHPASIGMGPQFCKVCGGDLVYWADGRWIHLDRSIDHMVEIEGYRL